VREQAQLSHKSKVRTIIPVPLIFVVSGIVTTVMELVNHKARTMLLCPLYSPAHLDIRSGNRGFSP